MGTRDTLVLEYEPYDPVSGVGGSAERFYFGRGAGWFLWTRADGARVTFNRRGGSGASPHGLVFQRRGRISPGAVTLAVRWRA